MDDAYLPARRRLGLDPACFAVLQCDRMAPRSGFDTAILGLAMLHRHHGIEARLLLAADDRHAVAGAAAEAANIERARLRQLATELGIESRLHLLCPHGDAARQDCFAASDVFVSTAWHALPGAAERDAMAWGRPVIGIGLPGGHQQAAGAVVDGVSGWLIAPRDAQALADRLARLRRCPDLARGMGRAARAGVQA